MTYSLATLAVIMRMLFANIGWEVLRKGQSGEFVITDNHKGKWLVEIKPWQN